MRRFSALALLLGVGLAVTTVDANAVPAFTRQTGLTCNQCHISFSPVPTFTFTGKKFRLNGYRLPFIADKIEAGEEGTLSGNRLNLGFSNYFSFRYGASILSQSKSAYDPAGPEPEAGPLESNPFQNSALFVLGPLGEHIGFWNEFYFTTGNHPREQPFRYVGFDEFDLRYVVNTDNSILGVAMSTQSFNQLAGFGPFPTGLTSHLQRGGYAQTHTPYVNFNLYGFFNDRILTIVGVQPGEDNLDYDRLNYMAGFGFAPFNSDAQEAWIATFIKVGNDAIPITTNASIDDARDWQYSSTPGLAAIQAAAGQTPAAYVASDMGDFIRTQTELRYGFYDRGPHSIENVLRLNVNKETYEDNAEAEHNALGFSFRYNYDRTWGVNFLIEDDLSYTYTDINGTEHEVERPMRLATVLSYRPVMNLSVNLSMGRSVSTRFGTAYEPGWSWNLGLDWLY